MSSDKKRKLPEGWRWEELGNLFTIEKQQINPFDESFYLLRFIGMENIESNTRKFIPNGNTEESGDSTCLLFDNKHVLYGKLRPYLNKVYLPDKKGRCSTELIPLIPKNGFSRSFIASVLQSEIVVNYAVKHSTGGRMPRADMDKLRKFMVPIPSNPNDQLAIASDLERRMAHVEKMRGAALRQKEAIAAMQGSILREVFSYEAGDELPEGWKLRPLRENCFINPSKRKGFTREPNAQTSFVPMEAVDEETGKIAHIINRNYFEISKGYTFFEDGDVLFAKITPCMQNGKSAIAQDLIDGVGFGSTEFHVLRPKKDVTKEWIYFYIRTAEFRKRAKDHFEGSAGQQRVSTDFIENSLIPLPPTLSDQIAIVDDLEHKMAELEKARQAAERQLEAIKMLPGAILREVFDFEEENTGS
jgi:type I restriction enzyme S subunit